MGAKASSGGHDSFDWEARLTDGRLCVHRGPSVTHAASLDNSALEPTALLTALYAAVDAQAVGPLANAKAALSMKEVKHGSSICF